jgi:hypothetical protein
MAKKIQRDVKLREEAQKFLANVPEEYVFWCCEGRVFRNMQELGDALGTMIDDTFAYHANAQKNDFSNWVRDIIKDDKLAQDLEESVSRMQAANAVASRIAFLTSKLA